MSSEYNRNLYNTNNILIKNPGFIVRFSLIMFLIILMVIVSLTWIVPYPELISCKANIHYSSSVSCVQVIDVTVDKKYLDRIRHRKSIRLLMKTNIYPERFITGSINSIYFNSPGMDFKIEICLPANSTTNDKTSLVAQKNIDNISLEINNKNLFQQIFYHPIR
jgi:hypothetical protein